MSDHDDSDTGSERLDNLQQFFREDGRSIILPIDHGTAVPVPGLESPRALIEELNPHVDGYVVNLGLGIACLDLLEDKGVCLRTDCYKPVFGDNTDEGSFRLYSMDEAATIGANAVMNMCYVHHPNEVGILRDCAELIAESLEEEIPVILETLPFGIGRPADYTVANIGFAMRMAAELGADVVKTAYPTGATVEQFRALVDACFVPVIVLGGSPMGDDRALLTMVRNALDAGAVGIAIGRNVWQHPTPKRIAAALEAVVHEDASVESALLHLK